MEKTLFKNLLAMVSLYRVRFASALTMLIISNFLLILNPLVFRQAIISLDPHAKITDGIVADFLHLLWGNEMHDIWLWALLLLCISAISAIFKYGMRMAFISISRDAEKEIRERLFIRIQSQSKAFFDRHGIGELISRLTNDISAYRDLLGPGIMFPLFFITIVFPGVIALFTISVPLTLVSLIPLLLIPLLNEVVRNYSYRLSLAVQDKLGEMSNASQEHYAGIRIVKGYSIESREANRFANLCQEFASLNFKLTSLQGLMYPLFTLLTKMITVLLVLVAGVIILEAWSVLTVADFISFMWIQSYIFFPILMLGWVLPMYERGRASYDRLLDVYNEPNDVQDNAESDLKIPLSADIVFRDLTFFYPGTLKPALSHLNLHIKWGSFVGITGPIGAGKSTLFHLLNREYEIPKGVLFIGGHEIHEYPLTAFRTEMVTVEQVAFLFSRTLADNVKFGRSEATQEELEMVARFADLHGTVMDFPAKYDTMIGERGVTLSGGQKQRVAMARAFLVNRSILLLDDIFSAVDAATEQRIFEAVSEHFAGRTVLLITHRVSILEQLNHVIYMADGKVVEEGTPASLMEKEGRYAALVALQKEAASEK
ncbi:MAG: ABC transporter ATP-binding protein [Parachlamydiaceae bacterium]|nr:ABC transporter ATP-binding protein [Parachlamydiaceae bacterium]